MTCSTLKAYYVEATMEVETSEEEEEEDRILAALRRLEGKISRVEYLLVRPSTRQVPAFKVPDRHGDTERNSQLKEQGQKPEPKSGFESLFDSESERVPVEIYAQLAKPLAFEGVDCCIALTDRTAEALLHDFLRSRPLYALGRPSVQVLDSTLKALSFSVFDETAFPQETVLKDPVLRALVKKPQKVLPIMLTRGVLSLCCWLKTAFSALSPSALRPERSYAYIWVGESRIGKTMLSQHLLASDSEYHRGGIHWESYVGRALQIYDDLTPEDKTICDNVKTLFNTCDKGTIRRPYGYTQIEHSAVLVLLNAESFRKFKEVMSLNCMTSWLTDNTVLYPFENSWDPDSDIVSDCDVVYGSGAKTAFGPGIVQGSESKSESGPGLSSPSLGSGLRVSTLEIEHGIAALFGELPDIFEAKRAELERKGCTDIGSDQLVPKQEDLRELVRKQWERFSCPHNGAIPQESRPESESGSGSEGESESEQPLEFSSFDSERFDSCSDSASFDLEAAEREREPRKHRLLLEHKDAKRPVP